MDDFATLPGGIYLGSDRKEAVDADQLFPPGAFDNLILTFGGNDSVDAGRGDDLVFLGGGNDTADGGRGNDTLLGEGGNDQIAGGNGSDFVSGDDGNDTLSLGSGDDTVDGGRGHDQVFGAEGNDLLSGGGGHDLISGGAGDDTIYGDDGNDTLSGDSGADVFLFESGFGKDVVLGFEKGVDTLAIERNINGLDITSPADLLPYIGGKGVEATISLGNDTIRLVGVTKADLIANIGDYVKIV